MVIVDLISRVGLFANFILFFITVLSVVSWTLILISFFSYTKKIRRLCQVNQQLKYIQNLRSLSALVEEKKEQSLKKILSQLFLYLKIKDQNSVVSLSAQEFLDQEIDLELYQTEKGIQTFSLISQVAPFLGLLGTIWGIMNAFYSIGAQGSANISVVAPGISEALITTVWGLMVAIPATIAYFYFDHLLKKIEYLLYKFSSKVLELTLKEKNSLPKTKLS